MGERSTAWISHCPSDTATPFQVSRAFWAALGSPSLIGMSLVCAPPSTLTWISRRPKTISPTYIGFAF